MLVQVCLFIVFGIAHGENGISLSCSSSNMTLYIDRNSSIVVDVPSSNISLLDTNCHATSNQSHFILSSGYHMCGTQVTQSEEEFFFENVATVTPPRSPNDVIMTLKHAPTSIRMECHLKRSYVVSDDVFVLTGDGFSAWSAFSECSVSCGDGLETRTRECLIKSQPNQCNGTTVETKLCAKKPCTLTCAELVCNKPFEMCYETFNQSQPATCVCKPAYVSINNSCVTSEKIVEVAAFKLNITFQPEYTDLTDQKTTDFTDKLVKNLRTTLKLSPNEYVKIFRLYKGSILVDFIILLKNDTRENQTTIFKKLDEEIKNNATGSLQEYNPVAEQVVVVIGADLCSLDSDECNRTTSTCQPTPGVGLNYRCNCSNGYEKIDDLTCRKIPKPTIITTLATTTTTTTTTTTSTTETSTAATTITTSKPKTNRNKLDATTITIICFGAGLLLLLLLICLVMVCQRRRQRKMAEEAMEPVDIAILDDSNFTKLTFPDGKRVRAFSSHHKRER